MKQHKRRGRCTVAAPAGAQGAAGVSQSTGEPRSNRRRERRRHTRKEGSEDSGGRMGGHRKPPAPLAPRRRHLPRSAEKFPPTSLHPGSRAKEPSGRTGRCGMEWEKGTGGAAFRFQKANRTRESAREGSGSCSGRCPPSYQSRPNWAQLRIIRCGKSLQKEDLAFMKTARQLRQVAIKASAAQQLNNGVQNFMWELSPTLWGLTITNCMDMVVVFMYVLSMVLPAKEMHQNKRKRKIRFKTLS